MLHNFLISPFLYKKYLILEKRTSNSWSWITLSDYISYSYKCKYFANNRIMFYFKTEKARGIYHISISIMVSGERIECPKLHPSPAELFCGIRHKPTDICSDLDHKYIDYLSCKNSQICPEWHTLGLNGLICMTYNCVALLSSYILR